MAVIMANHPSHPSQPGKRAPLKIYILETLVQEVAAVFPLIATLEGQLVGWVRLSGRTDRQMCAPPHWQQMHAAVTESTPGSGTVDVPMCWLFSFSPEYLLPI